MRKLLLGITLLLNSLICFSQYNDSTRYYTGLISTGSYNKTDGSRSYLLTNKLNAGVRRKDVELNFNNTWVYGAADDALTNNDFNSNFNCNLYKLAPHAYYWGLGAYTTSISLKVNNQYQAGGGLAYNIIDRGKIKFNVSDGLIYENSDIFTSDTIRDKYHTGRNSLRVQLKADTGIFKLNASAYLQNSLWTKNDVIVKVDASLTVRIIKWLSVTMAYSYNRVSRTGRENTLLTYGLTLEHYY
ncbi:DUF481 domain-containing protein [Taibaiella soli]|uniref:DUF481 domain-containing protein n=1 Tax=Taibaiella soli TaxID=1649169 RepID=UPI001A9CE8C2|nr:DUF481 domain-containing protein [Taibaiella soli]